MKQTEKQQVFDPVFLFMGEETFLMEEEIAAKRTALGEDAWMSFASYNAEETTRIEEVLALCNTMPFMGERRLIVLRNIQKLTAKALAQVAAYALDPADTTTLILTVEGQKPKKGDSLLKQLSAQVTVESFDLLKGQGLWSWIQKRVKRSGKEIEREAATLLADITAGHTWFIASEIEKLCLFLGARPEITIRDVEYLVLKSFASSIFAFQDALFDRKKEVLGRLIELEQSGVEPLEVIAMLENHVLDHYKVLFGPDWKWRNIHPYVQNKILARKSLWKASELGMLLAELRTIERNIKTGRSSLPFPAMIDLIGSVVFRKTSPPGILR